MSLHDAREELRYLLNRGYRKKMAVEFISNHYGLTREQRNLLVRTTFSDEEGARGTPKEKKKGFFENLGIGIF